MSSQVKSQRWKQVGDHGLATIHGWVDGCMYYVRTKCVHSNEGGLRGREGGSEGLGGGALAAVRLGEAHALLGVLRHAGTLDIGVSNHARPDDLDGFGAGRVATAHLHVHLGDGTAQGGVSVLLVHVDGVGAGQVTKVDTVVLDAAGLLLEDLAHGDDLTLDLSHLVLSLHVVPELALGEHVVTGEHAHSVQGGVGLLLGRKAAAHNVELPDLNTNDKDAWLITLNSLQLHLLHSSNIGSLMHKDYST